MKIKIVLIGLLVVMASCVQKSYKRTVIFKLNVKGIKDIKKVGLRGPNAPLSWDHDYEMKLGKDSIYTATISGETGYLYTEYKCTINDEFELKDQDNRRVYFGNKDTVVCAITFNTLK